MPTPRAPWTVRFLEVLADGRWHTLDELVAAAAPAVPPGRAHRSAEQHRARMKRTRGTTGERVREYADPATTGARHVVLDSVHSLHRAGRIERHPNGARYRLARGTR